MGWTSLATNLRTVQPVVATETALGQVSLLKKTATQLTTRSLAVTGSYKQLKITRGRGRRRILTQLDATAQQNTNLERLETSWLPSRPPSLERVSASQATHGVLCGSVLNSSLAAGMSLQVFHAPLILSHPDLFTLHSVMERSAEIDSDGTVKASKAQDKYGKNVKISKDLEGILQDEEVELVVIGVPNNLHFEYGKRCFEAGKHGASELPICVG